MLKIIKRDCKLPHPSIHTSIHPILQAKQPILHSFWTCFTPKMAFFDHFEIAIFNPILGLILGRPPPTGYNGAPMGKSIPFYEQKYCTTHFTQLLNPFYPGNCHFNLQKPRFKNCHFNPILGRPPPTGPQWPYPSHFTSKSSVQPVFTQLWTCFCLISMTTLHFSAWRSATSGHRVVLVEVVSTWNTYQCVLYTFVVILIPNTP